MFAEVVASKAKSRVSAHIEATAQARSYFADLPPSSMSVALFKDGELVYFLPHNRIERRDAHTVAGDLKAAFGEFCMFGLALRRVRHFVEFLNVDLHCRVSFLLPN